MTLLLKVTCMNTAQSPPLTQLVNVATYHTGYKEDPRNTDQDDKNNAQDFHDLHIFLR